MDMNCGETKAEERSGQYMNVSVRSTDPIGTELAQIIHDLKNPLSSIALETELLDARGVSCNGFDAAQAMARIRRNVRFLDRLIYDLVDVCTLSDGRFALRRTHCELGALVGLVIERMVPHAERHRVQVEVASLVDAVVDELRIERVIANLLDNALKYAPAHARIVVRVTGDATSACISVSDSGPGLSPAEIGVLFEPYRRGSNSGARTGTGLGLFVAKQIVEAHGGRIGVESVTGVSTRFFFALPLI